MKQVISFLRKNRFIVLSIMLVVFGVVSYVIVSANLTYEYKITTNENVNEENIEHIKEFPNIVDVELQRAMAYHDDTILLLNKNENIKIVSGRLPEKIQEVVFDTSYMKDNNLSLGEKIIIRNQEYNIVGSYDSKDSNSVGYCLSENVIDDCDNIITLQMKRKNDIETIKQIALYLNNSFENVAADKKNDSVNQLQKKSDLINENSKDKLDDANNQINEAQETIDASQTEADKYNKELKKAKSQLDEAKNTLESAKIQIDAADKELSKARSELDAAQNEFSAKLSSYGYERNELDQILNEANNVLASNNLTTNYLRENSNLIKNARSNISACSSSIDNALAIAERIESETEEPSEPEESFDPEEVTKQEEPVIDELVFLNNTNKVVLTNYLESNEYISAYNQVLAYYNQLQPLFGFSTNMDGTKESLVSLKSELGSVTSVISNYEEALNAVDVIDDVADAIDTRNKLQEAEAEYSAKYNELLKEKNNYQDGEKEYNDNLAQYNSSLKRYNEMVGKIKDADSKLNEKKEDLAEIQNDIDQQISSISDDIKNIEEEFSKLNIDIKSSGLLKTNVNYKPVIIGCCLMLVALAGVCVLLFMKDNN